MTLTKLRTTTYEQLSRTTDDPNSAALLKQISDLAQFIQQRFDIYSDLTTGATVAVPEGLQFDETENGCVATLFDGALRMYIAGARNAREPVQDLRRFALQQTGLSWLPVPGGYSSAVRMDGATVSRTIWQAPGSDLLSQMGAGLPVGAALEVGLIRGNTFLGVAVVGLDHRLFDANIGFFCGVNEWTAPGCPEVGRLNNMYLEMLLSGYLSTFPIT
jgi:hypothetical protein